MAYDAFPSILPLVLAHEGGWADHSADPGGATMKGVTQAVYSAYRERYGLPAQSVRHIGNAELEAIYRHQYWNVVRGDDLPPGVNYAVFDFAVNSGPRRAVEFLQRIVGSDVDGMMGERTLAAVKGMDAAYVIGALCKSRLAWLKRLRTWETFGRGWERRVAAVKEGALRMARGLVTAAAHEETGPGKALDRDRKPTAGETAAKAAPAGDVAGGVVAAYATAVASDPEKVEKWSNLLGVPPYVIFIGAGILAVGLIFGPRVLRWVETRN